MKRTRYAIILALFSIPLNICAAYGVDITGDWTGTATVDFGGGVFNNALTFVQHGISVSGYEIDDNTLCNITGSINGVDLAIHTNCPDINYFSDATATVVGDTMSGPFHDSQGTTGSFQLTKNPSTLTPKTKISTPPGVVVKRKSATFKLRKFTKAVPSRARELSPRASTQKLSVRYQINLRGAERLQRISKRNTITVKNLKPGNYTASYRASGVNKSNTPVFTTKASPVAGFTIRQ